MLVPTLQDRGVIKKTNDLSIVSQCGGISVMTPKILTPGGAEYARNRILRISAVVRDHSPGAPVHDRINHRARLACSIDFDSQ